MFNFSILVVIIAALLVIDKVYSTESHKNFKLTVIRGGAKPSKQAYSSAKSKKSKAKQYEDENDDEDDDDDDDDDRPVIKKKQGSSKSSSKTSSSASKSKKSSSGGKNKQRLDLVPAKRGKQNKKPSGFQLPAIPNLNFREKLDDLTKSSQSIYKDVYRRAKVMRSSPFEGMLLKATWPGNEPIAPELLNEIIRHSIPAFKYGSSSNAEDDPYHMTLHKLWTKMCEKDWRVVVKSTFILHCVSRDSSADTCEKFASAIKSMSKHRNPKKPNHKYFNIRMMTELDDISQTYQSFISAYATHVLYRAKNFIGKFDDLKQLPEDAKLKLVVSKLQKAKQCILNGLECTVTRKDHAKPVLGQAVKSVALDLRELWKIFSSKVPLLLSYEAATSATPTPTAASTTSSSSDESTTSTTSTASKPTPTTSSTVSPATAALKAEITELLTFYKETENKIQDYLLSAAKTFGKLKIKIPTDLDNDEVDMEQVNQKVTQLMNSISGGASKSGSNASSSKKSSNSSRSAKKVSKSIDDEDEDEDEEEEDEEDVEDDNDEDDDEGEDADDDEEEEESNTVDDEESEENDDDDDSDTDADDDNDSESKASGEDDEDDSSNNEDGDSGDDEEEEDEDD